ncbi:MAG: 4-(cytidine 5'-diphospho)-2-C-methyl-D-erythritol kinase [Lentimicrobium sp.]
MIVFPNAKLNIGLRVTSRRPDGYHNIETLMVPVKLADALEVTPSADGLFGFTSSGIPIDGPTDSNLCVKAFRLMQVRYGLPEVKIHLHKVIPLGAGLGGGSSDAVYAMKLLNRVFSLRLCNNDLKAMADELGSDCAFFLENRPCIASGKGEILSPIYPDLNGFYILIVKPDVSVSTAWAYSHVKPSGSHLPEIPDFPSDPAQWQVLLTNDFEEAVFDTFPEIAVIKNQMLKLGAVYASMSGSGSAVFGLFKHKPEYIGLFEGNFVWEGFAG